MLKHFEFKTIAIRPLVILLSMCGVCFAFSTLEASAQSSESLSAISGADWKQQRQNGVIAAVSSNKRHFFIATDPALKNRADRAKQQFFAFQKAAGCGDVQPKKAGSVSVYDCIGASNGNKGYIVVILAQDKRGILLSTEGIAPTQAQWIEASKKTMIEEFGGTQKPVKALPSPKTAQSPSVTQATPAGPAPKDLYGMNDIKTLSLNVKYGSGFNGAVSVDYEPYIYLKNGIVLKNFDYGLSPQGVAELKKRKPSDVGTWSAAAGGKMSVTWQNGKTRTYKLSNTSLKPVPQNASAFPGTYTRSGSGGTAGIAMVVSSKSYTFLPNGRFLQGEYFGGTGTNATVSQRSADKAGRWSIDGPHLILTYDNGTVTTTTLLYTGASPNDPSSFDAIWVSDTSYLRKGG